jgi:hypothetical protein
MHDWTLSYGSFIFECLCVIKSSERRLSEHIERVARLQGSSITLLQESVFLGCLMSVYNRIIPHAEYVRSVVRGTIDAWQLWDGVQTDRAAHRSLILTACANTTTRRIPVGGEGSMKCVHFHGFA